ncbi:Transmembrane amino acid transporter protein-domain-containing protein [Mycena venus]|uniref:Transmembrane amino acid transporter protein-domain-containing protein n=1 Tax=Mycena venus TaxID=2733690 RepID=A0A8H6WUE4_9AGAR|nr:Transmembrane amino acid transporter protein-domain-containing protein [Mycena venus]
MIPPLQDWIIAFVIGTGVPAIGALSGLIAAVYIFQFTYTFPPLLMLGLGLQLDAMAEDEAFTMPGVTPKRIDTWRDLSRWKRGFFSEGPKRVVFKAANLLFFIARVATAGFGMWATGTDLKKVIAAGAASSFGCAAPV